MTEVLLPVTFTFVSLMAIALFPLTAWVGLRRGKIRVLRGDGGDAELFKRIRIHGNLMENAPIFALVLGAAEISGLGAALLWLAVVAFVVGRAMHYALYDSAKRGLAMVITVLPGMLMGLWLLWWIWF